ncbi:MAG: hypothetical protein Q7W51_05785 [Coriobacteriia bacterium]|nr:hypothetical protein [Coriobacteriia bacterium]
MQGDLRRDKSPEVELPYPSPDGQPRTMSISTGLVTGPDLWDRERWSPLWRLLWEAEGLSMQHGFEVWQMVGYLLSDEQYVLPWISVGARTYKVNDTSRVTFEIIVPFPDIDPRDVADAYREARDGMRGQVPMRMTRAERVARVRELISSMGKRTYSEYAEAWNASPDVHPADRFADAAKMNAWVRRQKHDGKWS